MNITTLHEQIILTKAKADSAHRRIDERDDVYKELSDDIKKVVAWMNYVKGAAAAAVLMSGLIGGLVSVGVQLLLQKYLL